MGFTTTAHASAAPSTFVTSVDAHKTLGHVLSEHMLYNMDMSVVGAYACTSAATFVDFSVNIALRS
jgi:hypothetical protein